MIEIGNIVVNEYNHIGKLTAINGYDEAEIEVLNYGIKNDTDYCSYKKCRLATEEEILKLN